MIMYHHSEDVFHIYVTVELRYASNLKYARRNINPYYKVHRSFEQKDYELNHINNSCSVWNATYFHQVCAFSIDGYIDI